MTVTKRMLGIDYGSRRLGIAVSDPLGIIAKGIGVVFNDRSVIIEIKRYIDEYDPAAIIIGMPLNLKGEKGQKALEVEQFISQLEREITIEVIRWDERFTTSTAHETMLQMGVKKKDRRVKSTIDEMAAALILQSYLDSRKKL